MAACIKYLFGLLEIVDELVALGTDGEPAAEDACIAAPPRALVPVYLCHELVEVAVDLTPPSKQEQERCQNGRVN